MKENFRYGKNCQKRKNIHRKILVVDDEAVNRKLLGFIISQDYESIYAENGIQALQLIRENEKLLSLILLDLLMPEMNGYELLEIAHGMKGMYTNLSLSPLSNPVIEITELLRNQVQTDYSPLLNEIKTQFKKLKALNSET